MSDRISLRNDAATGIEAIEARFAAHAYDLHRHDEWLVGVTDRFSAAVAENGVTNQVSAWGTSYFGVHYNRRARLGDPLSEEGMLRLWQHSPLRNAPRLP